MKKIRGLKFVRMKGNRYTSNHDDSEWELGKWRSTTGVVEPCVNGFHASENIIDVSRYRFKDSVLVVVEAKGKIVKARDKFVSQHMRIVRVVPTILLQIFAYDCVMGIVPLHTKKYPGDKRIAECLKAIRIYLSNPSEKQLAILKEKRDAAADVAYEVAAAADAAYDVAAAAAAYDVAAAAVAVGERKQKSKINKDFNSRLRMYLTHGTVKLPKVD
jgi:hypothetical protein